MMDDEVRVLVAIEIRVEVSSLRKGMGYGRKTKKGRWDVQQNR